MIDKQRIPYEKCIFVCVNDHHGQKPSCGDHKGEEIFRKLRETAKVRGLHPRMRVTQAKCLGQCSTGTTIMIYPNNIWYRGVTLDNLGEIIEDVFQEL
ncbi:MAG: (2Fe-2S) ferredoxin domain-containing protein [Candidatus Omnitrophica bacterium]|nr:(2Fe-2S) ferredoxin domain-containing protein [Candidatus Omnitrophota bacterium]